MKSANLPLFLTAATLLASAGARADDVSIRRDTVVPIVFNETIDAGKAKVGDIFSARVDGGRDLPRGAKLTGRIERVAKQNGNKVLTMRFDQVRLPDGNRYTIDALPVPLDANFLKKSPDGRITAKRDDRSRETKVLGGLVGGLAVGSIFGKAKEGALLGTLIGAGLAIGDKNAGKEIAVKKGTRYGAMFERDVSLNIEGRVDGGDPYDPIRNPGGDRDEDRRDDDGRWEDDQDRDAERRDRPRLYRDGREIVFNDLRPIQEDGTLWLPVRETAKLLNLTFTDESSERDGERRELYTLEGNDRLVEIDGERDRIRIDGRRQEELKILRRDGVIYVPLGTFSPLVQERLTSEESGDRDGA